MAGTTVIDQLVVKLGLDPRDFTKGEKLAAAETIKLENQVKKSSESMGRSFVGFTSKVAGIAGAAMLVKKFIQYTSELSTNIRQLGIDSDNFGVLAADLRNFGNVSEMMGGKAEDATRTVGGLTKAVYDLAYNGQISDSLIMLGRLGVQFQDTTGNMRDFKAIALDTQAAIQQRMANGMSRANAFQMLTQAGFDSGLANAMLAGNLQQQLDRQAQRRQVSREDVNLATGWEQSAANRSQALDAAALRQLPLEAVAGTKINDAIAAAADRAGTTGAADAVGEFGSIVKEGGKAVKDGVTDFLLGLEKLADKQHAKNLPRGRAAYESTIQAAAAKFGMNPEMLAGLLDTESKFNPAAESSAGALGIAQLMPKFFPDAGKNPHNDIWTAAEYLSKLQKDFVRKGDADEDGAWYLALQSYNAGQSRVRASMRPGGRPLAQETVDYPGKVLDYAGQAIPTPGAQSAAVGNQTDITFENVTVVTPRTDGEGVAAEFTEATRRKMLAAHADTGVQ